MFVVVYLVFIGLVLLQGNRDLAAGPILWIAVFLLAAHANARVAVPVLAVAAMGDVTIQLPWLAQAQSLRDGLWLVPVSAVILKVVIVYTICAVLGAWVTLQHRRAQLALERTALIQREAEARVREAVARERNKMARELHDVAAHHLSGIAIQSRAALHVHPNEPDTVASLLLDIRRQSQDTLTSLRQIVGILRDGDDQELSPQPMLEDINDLVASIRRMGTAIDLRVDVNSEPMPPAISLACYRIVQESLSNVQKHASSAEVVVVVEENSEQIEILVENSSPKSSPSALTDHSATGYGITGMRERVQILGGTFQAGPISNGGWRNRATIPVRERVIPS